MISIRVRVRVWLLVKRRAPTVNELRPLQISHVMRSLSISVAVNAEAGNLLHYKLEQIFLYISLC